MSVRNTFLALALIASPITLAAPAAYAAKDPVYTGLFGNTAIDGHDPVAYFTDGKPVKGSKEFTTEYQGAEFRFSSQENLDTFLSDPEKYAPQYGGYCAWAAAQNKTAPGKPDFWALENGKLYLNFSKQVQEDWNEDRSGFITKADQNWPDLLK